MQVLFIAAADPHGHVHRLARLLRRHQVARTRVVLLNEPRYVAPGSDLVRLHDGGMELMHLLGSAEIVHLVDLVPSQVPLLDNGRRHRFVLEWTRAPSPAALRECEELVSEGACVHMTQPGLLSVKGASFLPPLIATWQPPWIPLAPGTRGRARSDKVVLFASTTQSLHDRPQLESLVDDAEQRARSIRPCRVELLAGRIHRQLAQRQRRANLVLAAVPTGVPRASLEALAQGLPTIVATQDLHHDAYARLAGGTPPPLHSLDELEHVVGMLDPMAEPDLALRAWARCALNPERWLAACDRMYRCLRELSRVA